jgi:hypothetical protein
MNSRLLPETADPIWLMSKVLPRIDRSAKRHPDGPRRDTSEGLPI